MDLPEEEKREREREVAREQHCIRTDHSPFFFLLDYIQGGKCTQGEEDSGFLRDVLGDDKTHAGDHLAYCECKEGWIGL